MTRVRMFTPEGIFVLQWALIQHDEPVVPWLWVLTSEGQPMTTPQFFTDQCVGGQGRQGGGLARDIM